MNQTNTELLCQLARLAISRNDSYNVKSYQNDIVKRCSWIKRQMYGYLYEYWLLRNETHVSGLDRVGLTHRITELKLELDKFEACLKEVKEFMRNVCSVLDR